MTSKTKNKLKWIPSVLAALMITASAIAKLAALPQLVQAFAETGIPHFIRPLAIAELLFISLFLVRNTMQIGFLLLTAYYGGAIAIEVANGGIFMAPAAILTIVWIASYLRNPSIFTTQKNNNTLNIA